MNKWKGLINRHTCTYTYKNVADTKVLLLCTSCTCKQEQCNIHCLSHVGYTHTVGSIQTTQIRHITTIIIYSILAYLPFILQLSHKYFSVFIASLVYSCDIIL